MTPRALAVAVATLLAAALALPAAALACSCAPPPDAAAARDASPLVVQATWTGGPTEVDGQHHYTFDVVKAYKGEASGSITVSTAMHGAACGRSYDKTVGTYLIYATAWDGAVAKDNLCSRTRSMKDGEADLAVLEAGAPSESENENENENENESENENENESESENENESESENESENEGGDTIASGDATPAPEPEPEPEPEPSAPADDVDSKTCAIAPASSVPLAALLLLGFVRRR